MVDRLLAPGLPSALGTLALTALALAASGVPAQDARTGPRREHDLLIRSARLVDGTGNPWRLADVAVTGDRITAVARPGRVPGAAARTLDAAGLVLAPGFVDVHSHAARGLVDAELGAATQLLLQGITTVVVNPDGGGPVDLAWQRKKLLEHGLGVHVAQLVPHGAVRRAVLRMSDRAPAEAQLERMRGLVRRGMEEGAFGLSTGLFYAPGSYATTDEVVALAEVVASYGGVYSSHIRDESDYTVGVVAAVGEVVEIAERAGLPCIVSHAKALGPRVWGESARIVAAVEDARARGLEVWADQYPYDASGTSIEGALIPRWALVDGRERLVARIADPETRSRLLADVAENLARRGGPARLVFRGDVAGGWTLRGRTLADVAEAAGRPAAEVVLEIAAVKNVGLISFNMSEEDIERLMRQPWTMTCTDGTLTAPGSSTPHPRSNGAFARKLHEYVATRRVVSLEHAVRSMTSLPASVFGIPDRGLVAAGMVADLVLFDPERVVDRATYDEPHRTADGFRHVLVAGRFVLEDSVRTAHRPGRVLRRP